MKKNKFLIALLLLGLTLNTCSMEQIPEDTSSLKWVALAGGVLLGAVGLKRFLSYIHDEPITPFPFGELPPDVQGVIISFLGQYTSAKTVEEAAHTINALARTSKQLEQFINNPHNCLQIIKNLARKFNCSDMYAAQALKTKEARGRVHLQIRLIERLARGEDIAFMLFLPAEQGADFEFTYDYGIDEPSTPLMILACNDRPMPNIYKFLLEHGVNINTVNNKGKNALMIAIECHTAWFILSALNNPDLNINHQDNDGNTAIMLNLMEWKNIQFLTDFLRAGSDPEIANKKGETLLILAQKLLDAQNAQMAINIINKAIAKKHRTKALYMPD